MSNEKNEIEEFLKERNNVLLSLDEKKIRIYGNKYNIFLPSDSKTFWAGVHKARLQIKAISLEERKKSEDWLKENNFKTDINIK